MRVDTDYVLRRFGPEAGRGVWRMAGGGSGGKGGRGGLRSPGVWAGGGSRGLRSPGVWAGGGSWGDYALTRLGPEAGADGRGRTTDRRHGGGLRAADCSGQRRTGGGPAADGNGRRQQDGRTKLARWGVQRFAHSVCCAARSDKSFVQQRGPHHIPPQPPPRFHPSHTLPSVRHSRPSAPPNPSVTPLPPSTTLLPHHTPTHPLHVLGC